MSEDAIGVVVEYSYPIVDAAVAEFLRQEYGAFTRRWEQISSGSSLHYIFSGRAKIFEVGVRSIPGRSIESKEPLPETLVVVSFTTSQGDTSSRIVLNNFLHWWEGDRAGMVPFRRLLTAEGQPEIRLVKPSVMPTQPPKQGASAQEYLDYRAMMQGYGRKITLQDLSKMSGIPLSTLKKASAKEDRS